MKSDSLRLDFLNSTNEIVAYKPVNFDGHSEQQEICEKVDIFFHLAHLHMHKWINDDQSEVMF